MFDVLQIPALFYLYQPHTQALWMSEQLKQLCPNLSEDMCRQSFESKTLYVQHTTYDILCTPYMEDTWYCALEAKKDLTRLHMTYQHILDALPELVFFKDESLRYIAANKATHDYYQAMGVTSLLGKHDLQLPLDPTFIQHCNDNDLAMLAAKTTTTTIESSQASDASVTYFEASKTPLYDPSGNFQGLIGRVRDVTTVIQAQERLEYLSYHDTLTGLYNRTFADHLFETQLQEQDFPVGLVLGDLNGLKLVNDILGHKAGDHFIQQVSKCLETIADASMYCIRLGGDELMIIIKQATQAQARQLIDTIQSELALLPTHIFPTTMSMGMSMVAAADQIDDAFAQADAMLYLQKQQSTASLHQTILQNMHQELCQLNPNRITMTRSMLSYARQANQLLELTTSESLRLHQLILYHDLGDIGAPLHQDKKTIHVERGYRFARLLPPLHLSAADILEHHECFDGSGFPNQKQGFELSYIARIFSILEHFAKQTTCPQWDSRFDPGLFNQLLPLYKKESAH
ncbi:MAG: diguanylate cyclase domain-containing protein [Erysipelotrichaceae bacterium]